MAGITEVSPKHHALSESVTQDVDTGFIPAIESNSCLQAGQRIMLHPVRRISAGGILYPQSGHAVVRPKDRGSMGRDRSDMAENSFLVSSRAAAVAEHEMMIISEILRLRSDSDAFQQFLRLPTWFGLSRLRAAARYAVQAAGNRILTHRSDRFKVFSYLWLIC
jgi:hypothetical protein